MNNPGAQWHLDSPLSDVPKAVHGRLASYLAESTSEFQHIGTPATTSMNVLKDFIMGGGKRVRSTFAWAGIRAGLESTSAPVDELDTESLLTAISAFEFIQACALIHDDIVDQSDTRRGHPTAHRRFEAIHRESGWHGDSHHYGISQAILCGDLAFSWADDMFNSCGLPPHIVHRARDPWRAMRTEVISGQILDLAVEANGSESVSDAMDVITYKTASYTVARPLHIGAALTGASQATVDLLRGVGHDIGVAFQLRDDQLGVFGDPSVTGKPAGDDLRTGKRTTLINLALAAGGTGADELRRWLGTGEQVDLMRTIITDSGAQQQVEDLIESHANRASSAISSAGLSPQLTDELMALSTTLTHRTF
ncbi:MAG TPA: polyprenyl synthetase family protein [Candidatus Corynebacterium gallistercoris]|uniref:Polyprenyl synthetase family protein n=1 Tax=Candidatus Corynebacterium gallistercoris TaxID=2838530 RepID=A0A9D1RYB4_9CORY|nr:polyprenyl synthetase family protein [Candidatus Corynebacterium gallistercoris]